MITIKFKNLEKSELAKEAVEERLESLTSKFTALKKSKIEVTLEMENSPAQAGPDLFKVKVFIKNGEFKGVTVNKSNSNLYIALADVVDHMLEVLNRFGDKNRIKQRKMAREFARGLTNQQVLD